MVDIVKERDRLTIRRKKAKAKIDSQIDLANTADDGYIRLIDEGAVMTDEQNIRFYIKKDVLRHFVEHLDSEYEGYITLAHLPFEAFPFLLGKWTKEDLRLVDIGDGRKGLDVKPTWDYESAFIKELQRQDIPVSVSIEAPVHYDLKESSERGFMVVDELFISGFSVVGDGANVNSNGVKLKGDTMKDSIKKLLGIGEEDATEEVTEEVTEDVAEEAAIDETAEVEADETTEEETADEAEETEEVTEEELSAEEDEAEDTEDETEEGITMNDVLDAMREMVDEIAGLRTRNEELSQAIENMANERARFAEKFKGITLAVNGNAKAEEKKEYIGGHQDDDGIGAE